MQATSPIYCIEPIHNLSMAGAGDGNVFAFDNDTFECLYEYSNRKNINKRCRYGVIETGAVRWMKITDDKTRYA
jgi:hypothetical protein